MTTIAITGATGFIGSALARALSADGKEIVGLSRPTSDRSVLDDIPITWIEGDITDKNTLKGVFRGVDWLVHAAGMLGRAGVPESDYKRVHGVGTENVLAEAGDCSRVLHISSPGVLGPIVGSAADENAPLRPSNAYERSKAEAEKIALNYVQRGLPVVIARPEFIYGPGDKHVLGLFQAIQRGMFFYIDEGRHTCHPTFINDAVSGLVNCLKLGEPGEIYHIAGPKPVSFREFGDSIAVGLGVRKPWLSLPRPIAWTASIIMELIGRITGRTPPLSRDAVAFFSEDRQFSWQKAHQALAYTPSYDLSDGLEAAISWYRIEGWLA